MRIGIVTQSYYPRFGGVTEHVHYTATELARRDHVVTIISSHFPDQDTADSTPEGVAIVRIGRNVLVPFNGAFADFSLGLGLKRRLRREFEQRSLDVVHIHGPAAPSLPLLAVSAARCPTVGTFHMTGDNRLQSLLANHLAHRLSSLDARIAVSETAQACAQACFPADYTVIPNGVDVDRYHPAVAPFAEWKDHDHVNVLFVGRLDPRKGVPDLIAAASRIVRESNGRARLLLVGNSPLRGHYEASVPSHLRSHVHFLGAVPAAELPRWYATADVCVSPATGQESFGIVLLEAMAAGKALVCSDLPGYRSAMAPSVTALAHPPGDVNGIADAVLRLCNDERLRADLGNRARQHALQFSWSRITDRIEALYRSVVPSNAVRRAA